MKAAICDRYGPPENVVIRDMPKPVPGDDDVLVRMRATSVNSGDARLRAANVPSGMDIPFRLGMGILGPRLKVMGFDVAGEVEAVGRNVTAFKPGDRVIALKARFKLGGHAEYLLVDQNDGVVVPIPDAMSFEAAAALYFGGVTSLVFFDLGKLKAGDAILINGASGAVGVMAVQIARHMGAHVTAICSAGNAALVRELGAEAVIDYAKTDVARLAERFDVIMDNHGTTPYARVRHLLKPDGRFLMVIGTMWEMMAAPFQKQVFAAGENDGGFRAETLRRVVELAAAGAIRPVISRTLPFDEIVEAYRIVDTGHKVGSVVLAMP
jgi:NADPH:quinone reductase-like Zn-dependent oxidoreductase